METQSSWLVPVLAACALAAGVARLFYVRWRLRWETEIRRLAAWIAEIARTVSADKKQAEKRARPLGAGSLREVLGRLENLELEARVLSEHSLFSAGNSARLRSLQLQAEAARLNDAVYRMVLVRSDCDAVMRDLHDALHAASAHKQA